MRLVGTYRFRQSKVFSSQATQRSLGRTLQLSRVLSRLLIQMDSLQVKLIFRFPLS